MNNERVFKVPFADIYPLYVRKVERKGRTIEELHIVLFWLTGYDADGLQRQIAESTSLSQFFDQAPAINPNAAKITGVICGIRVQEITDPLMQKIRWMDKLVDELANGKSLDKILRA